MLPPMLTILTVASARRAMHWVLVGVLFAHACWANAAGEVRIGIEPYFSPNLLLSTYAPLRDALEKSLSQPVVILTAGDYRQFVERVQQHSFDLVIIGSHAAGYLQRRAGYLPGLKARSPLAGLIVVKRQGPMTQAADLGSATVALPDELTITSMAGEAWFGQRDMHPNYYHYVTQNAVVWAVLHGDARAGVVSKTALIHMPTKLRDGLRILAEAQTTMNTIMMVNGRLDRGTQKRYLDAVATFIDETKHGDNFAGRIGIAGVDLLKADDLKPMDAYSTTFEERLKASP